MSRVQKFPSNSESACPPFAPGKRKAKSTQSELVEDTGSTTSQPSSKKPVDSTACDGISALSKPTPKKKKEEDTEEQKGETLQRKIRLFPTAAQTIRLKRWMEASRWSYNLAVFAINQRHMANQKRKTQDKKVRRQFSAISLRNVVARTRTHLRLFEDVPVHIMSYAVTDAVAALESNIAKCKKNPKHHFELHYKRTNDPQTAITIEKTAAKILDSALMFYPSYMEKLPIRCSKIPSLVPRGKPQCDNRLSVDAQGHFYFHDGETTCHSMQMMHVYTIISMVNVALGVSGHFFSKTLEQDLSANRGSGNISSGFVTAVGLTNLVIGATIIASPGDCSATLWLLYVRVTWLTQICAIGAFVVAAIGFFLYYFFEDNPVTGVNVQLPSCV